MKKTIVDIGRSDVQEGKLDKLKAGIRPPRRGRRTTGTAALSHGCHVDEAAHRMTVVVVHTDSASLELQGSATSPTAHSPRLEHHRGSTRDRRR